MDGVQTKRRIISVLVDNEAGILARVIGMFSGRGYNIDSLTVTEVDREQKLSRITIVIHDNDAVVIQIKALIERMIPVHEVTDLTELEGHIERELALIKVASSGEKRVECLRLADAFRARVVDATNDSLIFELTGRSSKIETFVNLMRSLGLVEAIMSGVVGISRGKEKT